MNQFEAIEKIWKIAEVPALPSAADIIARSKAEKNRLHKSIYIQAFCLFLSIVSLIIVVATVNFNLISSMIGIGLMFLAVSGFIVFRIRQAVFLSRISFGETPEILIGQFQQFHKTQKWVHSTGTFLYTLVLNLAFGFYFYETLILAPILIEWKIIFITAYLIWMLIATMILGRNAKRKELARTKMIIQNLKRIRSSLIK